MHPAPKSKMERLDGPLAEPFFIFCHPLNSFYLLPKMDPVGIITTILSALFMGTVGVFSKITGLGACFMLVFLLAIGRSHLICRKPGWPVLLNGCMLAGFIIFYVQAMEFTTMNNRGRP